MNTKSILALFTLSLICISGISQTRFQRSQKAGLFNEDTPLNITIELDIKEVTKDLKDRIYHPARVSFEEGGVTKSIHIKVKTRGKTRANPSVCPFPPLELNFKKKGFQGTIFDGQDKLKLVTHCSNRSSAIKYVTQEYITYKQYNLLTDNSFKVRMLNIKYVDLGNNVASFETVGILIEDKDILAERNNMARHKLRVYNQDQCILETVDLFTVFQFMIGNTDWSIPEQHNVKIISDPYEMMPIPIPYDFDNSGIINAHYAVPSASLGIESVRTRVFRGLCREPGTYEKVFQKFNEHKDDLIKLYTENEVLTEKQLKPILAYLNQFYKIINDPKKAKNQILRACRLSHDHKY